MENTKGHIWLSRGLAIVVLIAAALLCSGCRSTGAGQSSYPQIPPALPDRSLAELKEIVAETARSLGTLKADCSVRIASPLIRHPQHSVTIEDGELFISKPKKVLLRLYGPGKLYVKLVGDGQHYRVEMPYIGNTKYAGNYGDPIQPRHDRLHFMPDDLADAFDWNDLFAGKTQVLRTFPGAWQIDSVRLAEKADQALEIVNSILIDRRSEQIIQIDKFNPDGSLRVRIGFASPRLVEGPGGAQLQLPTRITFQYPMEGTIIWLLLTDVGINEFISDDHFYLQAWKP